MKILLVCTSGGHFSTMRDIKRFWSTHERIWVTDYKADTAILEGKEKVYWLPYQGPRDISALVGNIPKTFSILTAEKPDLVISTGASIAINFCFAAKALKFPFTYIESISRSQDISLTGKVVYPFCDNFYVQWPELIKRYPKALFKGYV
ncbi:MAG: PssD/Cps14F family polysaccharide biosynthesis glycosyltransferase [Kovacikia sp.]